MLFDHFGPQIYGPAEAKGVPAHPHRGFETVTYMLSGEMEHQDSRGGHGKLDAGAVQWMTAGSGLVHSEMPSERFLREGGTLQGFQIWVNLPRRDKMIAPHYQEFPGSGIPVASTADGKVTVKVIAGEALGQKARIETRTPVLLQHWTLQPGASVSQPVPRSYNALAYVISGDGEGDTITYAKDGDEVLLTNPASSGVLELLLIGGEPLKEPVARWGPFVMNSETEIAQALRDYRSGAMGTL
jgi:redox-sensitive bicupin YhaK (pirin superfamily)